MGQFRNGSYQPDLCWFERELWREACPSAPVEGGIWVPWRGLGGEFHRPDDERATGGALRRRSDGVPAGHPVDCFTAHAQRRRCASPQAFVEAGRHSNRTGPHQGVQLQGPLPIRTPLPLAF